MVKVALVFPGQGAQYVGMGKEFYDASPEAKAVFDEADAVLNNGLSEVTFNGPSEKLTSTAYCQPAILTFSLAALKTFEAHPKFKDIDVKYTAGLSLGEYSALAAAGLLSFADTLKLVERRCAFMEEATKLKKGAMAAVIGFDREQLKAVCAETGAEVANFNSPDQTVITGEADRVEAAAAQIKERGAKRVILLEVSGAFHSGLMLPAAEKFAEAVQGVQTCCADIEVISNVTARPHGPDQTGEILVKQITSSVLWEDSVLYMVAQGVTHFIEIGPGKVLKGLIRRTAPQAQTFNIEKPQDIEELAF